MGAMRAPRVTVVPGRAAVSVPAVSCGADPGTTSRGTSAPRTASGSTSTTGATSGSVSPGPFLPLESSPLYPLGVQGAEPLLVAVNGGANGTSVAV